MLVDRLTERNDIIGKCLFTDRVTDMLSQSSMETGEMPHLPLVPHFRVTLSNILGLPWWLGGKESICQCRRRRFNPWVEKTPWRRKWQPASVFLPGKSHGQRSLTGYSP